MSTIEWLKEWYDRHREASIRCIEFTLIALIFFGLGAFWTERFIYTKPPLTVTEPIYGYAAVAPVILDSETTQNREKQTKKVAGIGEYVASRNGKSYYRVDCPHRIKEENKIFFKTKEDAEKVGLTPAQSCF